MPVTIRLLSESDNKHIEEVVAIFADALGRRFITKQRVEEILRENNSKFVMVSFKRKQLVAARTVFLLNDNEKEKFEHQVRKAGGALDLGDYKVGMLASNAVHREFRRQGIGSQMVEAGLELLKSKGCTMCVATAWESDSEESSAHVLESFGFDKLATSHEHWKEQSIKEGFECPKCGGPPCFCSAYFYKKRI